MFMPTDQYVIIVTSYEGGTGNGSSTVFGAYIEEVLGLPVHIIGFKGFRLRR